MRIIEQIIDLIEHCLFYLVFSILILIPPLSVWQICIMYKEYHIQFIKSFIHNPAVTILLLIIIMLIVCLVLLLISNILWNMLHDKE